MTKKPFAKFETIMLVDDSEIDNFINEKMIEGCAFAERIYVHTSSRSALEFLRNLQKTADIADKLVPKIIFLDINMPMLDGFQFIEEFETLKPEFIKDTKIVMLTTSINPSDIERAKSSKRIIRYVNKPLTQEVLAELANSTLLPSKAP